MLEVDVEDVAAKVRSANRGYQWAFLFALIFVLQFVVAQVIAGGSYAVPIGDNSSAGPFSILAVLIVLGLALTALRGFGFSGRAVAFQRRAYVLIWILVLTGLWIDLNFILPPEPDREPMSLPVAIGGIVLIAGAMALFNWPRLPAVRALHQSVGPLEKGEFKGLLAAVDRFDARIEKKTGREPFSFRRAFAYLLQAIGIVGMVVFIAFVGVEDALEKQAAQSEFGRWLAELRSGGEMVEIAVTWAMFGTLGLYLLGRMLSYRDGPKLVEGDQPIAALFLRSFSDDRERVSSTLLLWRFLTLGIVHNVRVEEALGRDLERFGSFVGIGQPGERLPKLGAARIYAEDDEWQTLVKRMIDKAEVILLMGGASTWVAWEAAAIRDAGKLDRTLIVLPHRKVGDRRAALENLATEAPALRMIAGLDDEGLQTVRAIHLADDGPVLYRAETRTYMAYRVAQAFFFTRLAGPAAPEAG